MMLKSNYHNLVIMTNIAWLLSPLACAQENAIQADHNHITIAEPAEETQATHGMQMGPMQGGDAPADARDPNAYAIQSNKQHAMHGISPPDEILAKI